MPKAKEQRPTFQEYVACRYTYHDEQGAKQGILVARAGRFHRTHGLQVAPIAE